MTDELGNALYFSRSPIPHYRDASHSDPDAQIYLQAHRPLRLSPRVSLAYPDLPVGPLEQAERLEQLRALENGFRIRVVETEYESLGVDTPADWQMVSELYERTFSDAALAGKTKT